MSKIWIEGEHYTNLSGALHWSLKGYQRLKAEGLWSGETSDEPASVEAVLSGNASTSDSEASKVAAVAPPARGTGTGVPLLRRSALYREGRQSVLRILGKLPEERRQGCAKYEHGRRIALKAIGKTA